MLRSAVRNLRDSYCTVSLVALKLRIRFPNVATTGAAAAGVARMGVAEPGHSLASKSMHCELRYSETCMMDPFHRVGLENVCTPH